MKCPRCGIESNDYFFEDGVFVYNCVPCQHSWEDGDNNEVLESARIDAEMGDDW